MSGVVVALCAPTAFVAVSFLIAFTVRDRPVSAGDVAFLLQALITEVLDFNLAVIAMMAAGPPTNQPPGRVIHRPVLLIHGFACNHSVWNSWLARLETSGFGPVRSIDLEPPLADIEAHAAHVERELRALYEDSEGSPVDVIAHSMGGLVARAALRRVGPGIVGQLVTIATPHHGTVFARLFRSRRSLQQMGPESPWLSQLNSEQDLRAAVPITSIYSLEDNLIVPARTAVLRHAHMVELRGIGHLGLLSSRKAIDHALRALAAD
jgi:pimeloyl-ACP methyl ester carboxylesterase